MVLVKHDLIDVEALADHYNFSKYYFWDLFRGSAALPPGVSKNGRNYRIDFQLFDPWFRGQKEDPAPLPPPVQDHQERPTRREALTALAGRLDLLQATVTSQGEKLDHLTRLVMTALKSGVNHDGKRPRK